MFFKQFPTREARLSYLFGCAGLDKAIAVDVVDGDEARFIEQARQTGVSITHVIDTDIHTNHFTGGRALAALVNAPYCLYESAWERVHFDFQTLHDGEIIFAGNVVAKVLHTPGHTTESICLLVSDKRRSNEPWFILTGDTLLVGAVGYPDLTGQAREMAAMLYDSLHDKLFNLPDELEMYPAHQAGSACGAGLSGKPSSTLGFEKRWNAVLKLPREEVIDFLMANIPLRPAQMTRILDANLRGAVAALEHV